MHLNGVLACAYPLAGVASMVMPQGLRSAPPRRDCKANSGLESWVPACEVIAGLQCPAADTCLSECHPTHAGPACTGNRGST